ncbi:MAG: hypothetical protein LQ348_000359 [Seirophora lacunosa]|nr:MAG: hypothetical protein LQ348_000359 [Seirophora lacunosa]
MVSRTEKPFMRVPTTNVSAINPSTDSLATPPHTAHQQAETYDPTSTDPFSPFYSHAHASESSRRLQQHSSALSQQDDHHDPEKGGFTAAAVSETNGGPNHKSSDDTAQPSLLCRCQAKRTRGSWRNMSKKQRIAVRVLVALLFIGAVTGLGLGVSKAMGTGIWKQSGGSTDIAEV